MQTSRLTMSTSCTSLKFSKYNRSMFDFGQKTLLRFAFFDETAPVCLAVYNHGRHTTKLKIVERKGNFGRVIENIITKIQKLHFCVIHLPTVLTSRLQVVPGPSETVYTYAGEVQGLDRCFMHRIGYITHHQGPLIVRSGVRTHADIRPLELKSNALTTRPS